MFKGIAIRERTGESTGWNWWKNPIGKEKARIIARKRGADSAAQIEIRDLGRLSEGSNNEALDSVEEVEKAGKRKQRDGRHLRQRNWWALDSSARFNQRLETKIAYY